MSTTERSTQYQRVYIAMSSGEWLTIPEIWRRAGRKGLQTAISARIRDARKKGHTVNVRRKVGYRNTYEYQLIKKVEAA